MSSPEAKPSAPQRSWSWAQVGTSLQAASNLAAQVGGTIALVLTPLILLVLTQYQPHRPWDWVCCCMFPFVLLVPLFFGGMGAAVAGIFAGIARGITGSVIPGLIVGGVAALAVNAGLYWLYTAYFPATPPLNLWLLAGPGLGILIGGLAAPFADPSHPTPSGQNGVPAPFRPLRFLGIPWELPRPGTTKTPRPKPGRSEGIQAPQPGVTKEPEGE